MSLKIIAVGDIMLGDQDLCSGFGVGSKIKNNGPEYLFKDVKEILKRGDIVFGNLECSINQDSNINYKKKFFCADPCVVPALAEAGFNALSVANNHIMENGIDTYKNTITLLEEQCIIPVGLKKTVQYKKVNGLNIALMGYSFIEDNISDVKYNKISDKSEIIDDLKKVRNNCDLIILSLHWGLEYVPYASVWQVETARKLIDAGADVILGGHSHVLQGYEIYNGKVIIYSLGNFVFDQTFNPNTRESAIFEIDLEEENKVNFTPIMIHKEKYAPVFDGKFSEKIITHIISAHSNLQGKTIREYENKVICYTNPNNPYHKFARKSMKIHFLRKTWRYNLKESLSIIKEYVFKDGRT